MVKKKGRAYRDELKEQMALEDLVKKCPNLSEKDRKSILDRMELWRKGAIEGDAEALIRLGHEFLGQN